MIKNIDTMQQFAEFLDKNDLVYAGNVPNPFSLIGWGFEYEPFECGEFKTIDKIEEEYNVKLNILKEVV